MKRRVTHVWVDGQMLMEDRKLLTFDMDTLMESAREWRKTLALGNPYISGTEEAYKPPF